jgi:predicted aconitase
MSYEKGKIDFVMFGCPHYSINQVREVARLLEGKTIHKHVEFWILTSFSTKELARRLGYLEIINKAGGDIMSGACPDGSYFRPRYKGKVGITDSPKAWYYPQRSGISFILKRRSECIEAALKGGC